MLNPLITTTMRLQFGELNITPRVVARLHELDFTVPELEDAIAAHQSPCDGEPSVYVGTYGKYNEGSLCGLWVDLSSFDDYDEFINFCKAIHADEEDPELMAQDYECFPRQWYNEEDFARHIVEECYDLERTMGNLAQYFDYEAFGRELFMWDYSMGANGHVFRRI